MTKKDQDIEHEMIRTELKGILLEIGANFEVMNKTLSAILDQAQKTNGRVTALESDIDFIRVIKKYKVILILVIIGLIDVVKNINIIEWIKKLF